MSSILQANTTLIDFGDVTVGSVTTVQFVLSCSGDEGCALQVPIVVSDPQFTQDLGAQSFDVGDSVTVNVMFAPSGAGTANATITYDGNMSNRPLVVSVTGRGVVSGSRLLSVSPSSGFTFPTTVNGTTSAEQLFVLKNTGTVSFNITALACNGRFQLGPTQPALPFTLNPGSTVNVGVQFIPNANLFFMQANGLVITSGALGSPRSIALAGTGVPFIAAYILPIGTGAVLAAFGAVLMQFAPGEGCEAGCATDRLTNLQLPSTEKGMYNVQIDYEDLGPATLLVRIETRRGDVSEQRIGIGTPAADEEVLRQIFNLQISEEVFHVKLFAVEGPISITGYSIEFEPGGDVRKDS